jgi:hypothetical protein
MLKQIDGKWALVSKKTQRPLAYYRGEGKPSGEWVAKQERRIQFFKHGFSESAIDYLTEASYAGNIGIMELVKFHKIASDKQKNLLQSLVNKKQNRDAWKLVQDVTGVKLHKSVNEVVSPDILPKSGAGQDGTDTLVQSYMKDTPGQTKKKVKSFKDYTY